MGGAIFRSASAAAQKSKEITKWRSPLCAVGDSKAVRCTGSITTYRIALKIAPKVAKAVDEEGPDCVEAWAFTFVQVVLVFSNRILAQPKALGHAALRAS